MRAVPMRLHATRESCDAGEITLLAIVETVLAVALLITLSLWLDTARWLAGACLLSPLLLLRTEESVQRGLRMNAWLNANDKQASAVLIGALILVFGVAVWLAQGWALLLIFPFTGVLIAFSLSPLFFVIRFTATLVSVIQHPLHSLANLPGNWRRIVLATDSGLHPEFLPGEDFGPASLLENINRETLLNHWLLLSVFLTIYPLTAAYRWSVKATCVVYLPLMWLVNTARYRATSVGDMLRQYLADEIQTVRRWALVLTGGFLIGKLVVLVSVDDILAAVKADVPEKGLKVLRVLQPYLTPRHIEIWQLTPVINGLLALGMWLFARRVLRMGVHAPADATLQRWWNVMSCLTLILSLYSIACLLQITLHHGDLIGTLRQLGDVIDWRFFPQPKHG